MGGTASNWPRAGLLDASPRRVFADVRAEAFGAPRRGEVDFAGDPVAMMRAAGMEPDPWQCDVLTSEAKRSLLLVTRQGGKSTTTAGKALHRALYTAGALVLLLSPSLRQSQELFGKVMGTYQALDGLGYDPPAIKKASALRVEFVHGSRILALPGTEKTVRGFSAVDLLVIDEAARVDDALYYSIRPMLAVSAGELMALTTPWGKRGFFYDEWTEGSPDWHRVRVTADQCPRIPEEFLEEERRTLPAQWFRSEYFCEFADTVDQVFTTEEIDRMVNPDVAPLFAPMAQGDGPTGQPGGGRPHITPLAL